jgi:hypothetical protein
VPRAKAKPSTNGDTTPHWIVEEAWRQLERAGTAEDRARALSTFRRSISTELKHLGEVTPELAERLAQLEGSASALYGDVADRHVRQALRGLASLRMAVEARLESGTAQAIELGFVDHRWAPMGKSWKTDRERALTFYGVPTEHRVGLERVVMMLPTIPPDMDALPAGHYLLVAIAWEGRPYVWVMRSGRAVWANVESNP